MKEGRARQSGREMQREAVAADVKCTNCGELNPSTRTMCSKCGAPLPRVAGAPSVQGDVSLGAATVTPAAKRKFPWIAVGGVVACLVVVCIGAFMLFAPSKTVTATVSDVYWQTSMPLQEMQAVNYSDQSGSLPSDAYNVSCHTETTQVCEDKTIDKGNGYAEVVTECHDDSTQYCSYTVDEWKIIQTYTLDGHDFSPRYSQPSIANGQRLGDQTLTLTVSFTGKGEIYSYAPGNLDEFQQFTMGSAWTLHLNALGGVVSVER